jgi:hypothetical protein
MATTQGINVQAILDTLAAEIAAQEATQTYKGYTVADLRTVFDAVCDPHNWKGPLTAVCTGEMVMATVAAIEFFTATVPTVHLNTATMQYVIESIGYQAGPAGDH